MVAPQRQRLLTKLLAHASKRQKDPATDELPVLDHLVLGVLQEGATLEAARAAHAKLLETFHDLNELRVSHPRELEDLLPESPEREHKARRILAILQFVFETTYAFDLESMRRKPLKQAQKQLSKITGATPFAVAATVQRALGGHALPVDEPIRQLLIKIGLAEESETLEQIRGAMEHAVPKAIGPALSRVLSEAAHDRQSGAQLLAQLGLKGAKAKPTAKPTKPKAAKPNPLPRKAPSKKAPPKK